jgi:hypothetical protein
VARRKCRPCSREFTVKEAAKIKRLVGIPSRHSDETVREGLNVEREHGDITCCDPRLTGHIVKAHLAERDDYYERLKKYVENGGS